MPKARTFDPEKYRDNPKMIGAVGLGLKAKGK